MKVFKRIFKIQIFLFVFFIYFLYPVNQGHSANVHKLHYFTNNSWKGVDIDMYKHMIYQRKHSVNLKFKIKGHGHSKMYFNQDII